MNKNMIILQYEFGYWQNIKIMLTSFIVFGVLGLILLSLSYLLTFNSIKDKEKLSQYECGFEPFDNATRETFDVQFYIVGILFLIFDVEVALFFPWCVGVQNLEVFSFYLMLFFVLIITIGFFYEWQSGALNWPIKKEINKIKLFECLILVDTTENIGVINNFTNWVYSLDSSEYHLYVFLFCVYLIIIGSSYFDKPANLVEKKKYVTPNLLLLVFYSINIILYSLNEQQFIFFKNNLSIWNYHSYLVTDGLSLCLKIFVVLSILLALIISKKYLYMHTRHLMEYGILMLLISFFLSTLVSSSNLLTAFFGIMGFSVNIYVLLLSDVNNSSCREAAIKYYYLSAVSSGFISIGIVCTLFLFNNLNYTTIALTLENWIMSGNPIIGSFLLNFILISLLIGSFFKLSIFPCHLWSPDVYTGSPHIITFLFIVPIKIALIGFFIRLFVYTFKDIFYYWHFYVYIASIFSIIYGALLAYGENEIKRFWAYSSINQVGLMLLGIVSGNLEGLRSMLIFLFVYICSNIIFFICFLSTRCINTNQPLMYLTDLTSYTKTNKINSLFFSIILFSMSGIPPFAGFFAKYFVLTHLIESSMYLSVCIVLVTNLLSTYYYFRLVKLIFFDYVYTNNLKFTNLINSDILLCNYFLVYILINFMYVIPLIWCVANKLIYYLV